GPCGAKGWFAAERKEHFARFGKCLRHGYAYRGIGQGVAEYARRTRQQADVGVQDEKVGVVTDLRRRRVYGCGVTGIAAHTQDFRPHVVRGRNKWRVVAGIVVYDHDAVSLDAAQPIPQRIQEAWQYLCAFVSDDHDPQHRPGVRRPSSWQVILGGPRCSAVLHPWHPLHTAQNFIASALRRKDDLKG